MIPLEKSMNKTMTEQWRPIINMDGCYSISNLGRVRSEERFTLHSSGKLRLVNTRILRGYIKDTEYRAVQLCRDGIRQNFQIHRLVAESWIVGRTLKRSEVVVHRDKDRTNNAVTNLEVRSER